MCHSHHKVRSATHTQHHKSQRNRCIPPESPPLAHLTSHSASFPPSKEQQIHQTRHWFYHIPFVLSTEDTSGKGTCVAHPVDNATHRPSCFLQELPQQNSCSHSPLRWYPLFRTTLETMDYGFRAHSQYTRTSFHTIHLKRFV